jgi:NAD-dependent deacetylase
MQDLIKKAAEDPRRSTYAIALTGAGVSTELGIPDFRGAAGIGAKNPDPVYLFPPSMITEPPDTAIWAIRVPG